jgi:L-lactate dehydrogenase complex protein LldE
MVQHYLPALFDEPRREGAEQIAHRVSDLATYVSRHPNKPRLPLKLPGVVAYHDSCHGRRELGATAATVVLLQQVQGLELRRLAYEDECCGFGGTFSVKLADVSSVIGSAKLSDVRATGARVLVSGDLSCLAHLESLAQSDGEPLETWTLAELLARALP